MPPLLLILDDDRERLQRFEAISGRLGGDFKVSTWRDAPSMLAQIDTLVRDAALISLDHDLYPDSASDADPGSGRQVAEWLAERRPSCPVIVHSTNTDMAWGMHNALRAAGWTVELVHHINQANWIEELWLPAARRLVESFRTAQAPASGTQLSLAEYRALVESLPMPTVEQARQFAEYVAGAHSWYKHLRLLPAYAPIQIYLDPAAGMQHTMAADGSIAVVAREKQGFHYSWLPTEEHLRRFGHLAFSKGTGTSVSLGTAGGKRLVPSDDEPRVYHATARALYDLPNEVLMAGRAYVSGVVHSNGSSRYIWARVLQQTESFENVLDRIDGLDLSQRILSRCQFLKQHPEKAEPRPARPGDIESEFALAAIDFPLQELVAAERRRQIESLAESAMRMIRLVMKGRGGN